MKNFLKILSKTILFTVIFCLLWMTLSDYFRVDKNIDGDQFRLIPENSADIIALGSSHMQYAVNPGVIYANSGYYAYDLGSSCQEMSMSYYMLIEALKTQSPEVVIIDVFTLLPAYSVCYADGMYYLATQQMTGMTQIEAANAVPNENVKYDYMFDLLMNHSNWKTMQIPKEETEITYDRGLGYVFQEPEDLQFKHLVPHEKEETVILDDASKKALDDIQQLCKEKGIHLILFKSPFDIDQENYDTLQAVWDYAEEKNIEYIDFIELAEEIGFTLGMDGDTWHNNTWGAEKVSRYLAQYIEEKGYVKSHTDNSEYDSYLSILLQDTSDSLLSSKQIDIYTLLNFGSQYPCVKMIRYTGSDHTGISDAENSLLQQNGFSHDFINDCSTDYYALVENNTVIQESSEPFDITYSGHVISLNAENITIDGTVQDENSEMTVLFTNQKFSQINTVPIDYASRFFWKNGCEGWNCTE